MGLWYQSPYNSRYPRIIEDTNDVRSSAGYITLERHTVVQPIRRYYLPRDCWLNDWCWSEKEHVACFTEKGFILVPLHLIDFKVYT